MNGHHELHAEGKFRPAISSTQNSLPDILCKRAPLPELDWWPEPLPWYCMQARARSIARSCLPVNAKNLVPDGFISGTYWTRWGTLRWSFQCLSGCCRKILLRRTAFASRRISDPFLALWRPSTTCSTETISLRWWGGDRRRRLESNRFNCYSFLSLFQVNPRDNPEMFDLKLRIHRMFMPRDPFTDPSGVYFHQVKGICATSGQNDSLMNEREAFTILDIWPTSECTPARLA